MATEAKLSTIANSYKDAFCVACTCPHASCVFACHFYDNPMRQRLVLAPFYGWWNWALGRLGYPTKAAQLSAVALKLKPRHSGRVLRSLYWFTHCFITFFLHVTKLNVHFCVVKYSVKLSSVQRMIHGLLPSSLLLNIKEILADKLFILRFRLSYRVMNGFITPVSHMCHGASFSSVPFYTVS